MAAVLDGEIVAIGDHLFDVLYGVGIVTQILNNNHIRVNFPTSSNGRTISYNAAGVSAKHQVRTIYWKDPVIVVPTKNDSKWNLIRTLSLNATAAVRAWVA